MSNKSATIKGKLSLPHQLLASSLSWAVKAWARQRNIHKGSTPLAQYAKCVSEIGELGDALLKNNKDEVEDAVGDALVVLINIATICQTDLNTCLERAYNSIKNRRGIMFNGAFVKETDANYERIVRHVASEQVQTDLFSKD